MAKISTPRASTRLTDKFISAILKSMKAFSAEESLWLALPLLIIILGLAAALIVFQTKGGEIRSKASEPKVVITPTPLPKTEVVCSSGYVPVCGANNITYLNSCEANQAGIINYLPGACPKSTPVILPTTN